MKTKVSVIVPVYNAAPYLKQCLNSVLEQDYHGHINIIVVDNESTDNSPEIIKEFKSLHSSWLRSKKITTPERFLLTDSAENIHKFSWHEPTRQGLKLIEDSEYFMFLAADDYLTPDYISNCMKLIGKAPDKIKALQSPVKFTGLWSNAQAYEYKNLEQFKEMMLQRSVVNTPTILWHRSFYDNGLMDLAEPDKYYGADDYALYCELATRGHFIWPAPKWLGYWYRIHETNASWGMHKELDAPNTIDKQIQKRYRKKWNL